MGAHYESILPVFHGLPCAWLGEVIGASWRVMKVAKPSDAMESFIQFVYMVIQNK